jgi:holliday junction DNA helicase RuvA
VITHLQGKLARMDAAGPVVEVDVAGVRYEVLVPLVLWPEIQAMAGEGALDEAGGWPEIGLHIFYSASANQPVPVLVGFLRRAERDFFRKFTTVEGIGPAKAVKAMNVSVSTIARAIEQEDRATLTRLPGIGTRGADKIIATLRGKVTAEAAMADGGYDRPVDPARYEQRRAVADAIEAITALGYPRSEAKRWVDEAMAADASLTSTEDVTMAVLRRRDAAR